MEQVLEFFRTMGFMNMDWQQGVMLLISFLLLYLAIKKQYEPLLLLPIAFGMLLTNLPGAGMYHSELWELFLAKNLGFDSTAVDINSVKSIVEAYRDGILINAAQLPEVLYYDPTVVTNIETTNIIKGFLQDKPIFFTECQEGMVAVADLSSRIATIANPSYHSYGAILKDAGLLDVLYIGVKAGLYPCLIFIGVGAMTDFGPLIANPKSLILGAAAQVGIFITFLCASAFFTPAEAGSIGIIGGADGPTSIFLTSKLAPHLLGPIAIAAYSYMALVPVIQPPIMRALTTEAERKIKMKQLRSVSKVEKIVFPIIITAVIALVLPDAAPLIGCLMLGNLMKESGVVDRLSKVAQNELMNIVVIFLGLSVGATATGATFLNVKTILILSMGIIAFGMGSAGGVLLAKFMNLFSKEKINPLIGSAGVSAVPMAARVSQSEGQKADPSNFLLMHAMGPNVAGVIGSAVAAGILLTMLG
ncbi:MAG: sodium ion-translocating decarboxylase subunit beta [Paludibacteraceae bacterium]|nr:sodium ion-translocating decarboxylase subunit beta [Paludibacteraceae bacterium]